LELVKVAPAVIDEATLAEVFFGRAAEEPVEVVSQMVAVATDREATCLQDAEEPSPLVVVADVQPNFEAAEALFLLEVAATIASKESRQPVYLYLVTLLVHSSPCLVLCRALHQNPQSFFYCHPTRWVD